MARTQPFDRYPERYDAWFDHHKMAYQSELEALRKLWPPEARETLEIGVGTGRFALPLGIRLGVEPSETMRRVAEARGLTVVPGTGEALPFEDERFDAVLMVTTLCFLDDSAKAFREIHRVLKPGGYVVVGFIDRESHLGKRYEREQARNPFYREATFYSTSEVLDLLCEAGFRHVTMVQTLFQTPDQMSHPDPVEPGYGRGAFVALRAQRPA